MKAAIFITVVAGTAVLFPAALSPKVVSKPALQGRSAKRTPGEARQSRAWEGQVRMALAAVGSGDPSKAAFVRATIARLHPNDPGRVALASRLFGKGEAPEAFDALRSRVHFAESSLPNDEELTLYAKIADAVGRRREAAWARGRRGEAAHFRIWMAGTQAMLRQTRAALSDNRGAYGDQVDQQMDNGLRLYPAHRDEIESTRQRFLSGSAAP